MKQSPVSWQKLYDKLSAPICSINCGTLCAPLNNGIPRCCCNDQHEPVLYTGELAWLASKNNMWHQMKPRTKTERSQAAGIEDYIKYSHCKGITHCKRMYRSLTCRFFPLEPYFEPGKKFAGLIFIYRSQSECPLIEHPKVTINQDYIDQVIDVWTQLFTAFPREVDCYVNGSRGVRSSMKRQGRKIRVFRASPR